jgi:hypothetical protein
MPTRPVLPTTTFKGTLSVVARVFIESSDTGRLTACATVLETYYGTLENAISFDGTGRRCE